MAKSCDLQLKNPLAKCLPLELSGDVQTSRETNAKEPLNALVKGLFYKDSRENKTSFELFLGPFWAWKTTDWDRAKSCNS